MTMKMMKEKRWPQSSLQNKKRRLRREFSKKIKVKMAETIENAIKKAGFLLKLMIPEAYLNEKTEELQRQLSRKQSQNIQQQSQGVGLVRAPSIKKRKSILVVQDTL